MTTPTPIQTRPIQLRMKPTHYGSVLSPQDILKKAQENKSLAVADVLLEEWVGWTQKACLFVLGLSFSYVALLRFSKFFF
jgi:hypothetical protein